MNIFFVPLLAIAITSSPIAANAATLHVSPGKAIEVGYYSFLKNDCSGGATLKLANSAPLQHGQMLVKSAVLKTKRLVQCGIVEAPTIIVVYKADPDFVGTIGLEFDVINTDNGLIQHVVSTIDVSP